MHRIRRGARIHHNLLRRRLAMGSPQTPGYLVSHGGPRTGGRLADDLSAAAAGVWETESLMEYVILIVVIAVLAVVAGGLLFLRPRRGRGAITPPSQPPAGPTTPAPG